MRPPSIPGLNRRSGRIPALPYPPIKHFDCTADADFGKAKSIHSGKTKAVNPGGLGGGAPIMTMTSSFWICAGTGRPASDSRVPGADAGDCRSGSSPPVPETGRGQ